MLDLHGNDQRSSDADTVFFCDVALTSSVLVSFIHRTGDRKSSVSFYLLFNQLARIGVPLILGLQNNLSFWPRIFPTSKACLLNHVLCCRAGLFTSRSDEFHWATFCFYRSKARSSLLARKGVHRGYIWFRKCGLGWYEEQEQVNHTDSSVYIYY